MGRAVVSWSAALLSPALALVPIVATAQSAKTSGVLFGVVRDSTGAKLARVDVMVLESNQRALSNDSGAYRIAGLPQGALHVQFRHVGFAAETTTVSLAPGEARELLFALTHLAPATELEATLITERLRGKMGPFNTRRSRGVGTFITRTELEARHPSSISELLRYVTGVGVQQRMAGEPQPVQMQRSARTTLYGSCTVRLYVDGHRYENGNVDDFHPTTVEGIEVYRSAAEVPADFRTNDAACGVIAIWTRDPDAARRRP